MRNAAVLGLVLALACGDGDADDGGGSSTAGGATMSADASSVGDASSSSAVDDSGSGGDDGLTHGFVMLELRRGESEPANPYVGTAKVIAVLRYGECLTAFYDEHPELRQDGPEGYMVFGSTADGGEGWSDRLCDVAIDAPVDCTIDGIVQQLDTVKQLTVVYAVSGELEGNRLAFGPLPTAAVAECAAELEPTVVFGSDSVKGTAANGTELWITESFTPAEVATNASTGIRVGAKLAGG